MPIILGAQTNLLIEDRFATVALDVVQVKGKTQAEPIFALLGAEEVRAMPEFTRLQTVQRALLEAFAEQRWIDARALLHSSESLMVGFRLGVLYELYNRRINEHGEAPPIPIRRVTPV